MAWGGRGEGGVATPLYGLYRCVRPRRFWFLSWFFVVVVFVVAVFYLAVLVSLDLEQFGLE